MWFMLDYFGRSFKNQSSRVDNLLLDILCDWGNFAFDHKRIQIEKARLSIIYSETFYEKKRFEKISN